MSETIENGESLAEAAERGLLEEFGGQGRVTGYLSSKLSYFTLPTGAHVEKTTIYFLMDVTSIDLNSRDPNDWEADIAIEWHQPGVLLKYMRGQSGLLDGREGEYDVLRNAVNVMSRMSSS